MEGRGAGAGPAVLESREDDVELHHAAECSDDDDDSCTKEDEFEKIEGKTREPNNVVALTHGMVGVYTKMVNELGMQSCRYKDGWSLLWGDTWDAVSTVTPKRFQRVNHFPGMSSICRKDLLGKNLSRLGSDFPTEYDFFPKTWLMPHDRGLLLQHQREAARVSKHPPVFIFKPSNSCQGKGIALLRSDKKLAQLQNGVVQQYIANPLLIDGHKADIRLYALVTAAVPEFRVFLFEDGLVRLASAKYTAPTAANLGDTYCHLTNYSLNKNSANFDGADGEGEGHKRKYSWLLRWMAEQGMPVAEVERRIHDVVVKTVLSVQSTVAHSYNSMYPGREDQSACCEILGFDIMLDDKLKPWLIEVNQSPSFSCDAELDRGIKSRLVRNTLEMVNLKPYNAYRERAAKTQRLRKMAYRTSRGKGSAEGVSDPSLNERLEAEIQAAVAKEARLSSRAEELRAHEDAQCASGGFTRLFPTYVAAKDEVYRAFTTTVPSLTSLTVACSARAKENMETRARVLKVEHDRRARAVDDDERLRAFKNHIKTRSAGAWRKGNPCCSTVSEDGEEASLPPAVRVRRRSPRVRTDLTPLRTRRVSLNIYSEVAAYPISFNVKPPTESETPPAAAGPDIPETPSHTSSVRDVRLGTWDASKCFHKNKPPPKLPNPKLPLSGFALWAASQISGRPLDPERGSTDLTDTCTDLKLPPCEWHKTMRNVLGNETPKLVTPCISDGRLDKDDLKTLFHFETDTESSNSTEHATSNQPAMFAKPAVPALQRASSLPVLPLLPQHSTADALARALRNRLEREKHKDQQKRGQMLRHLRHELYSSTHSTSTHSTLA